MGVAPKIVLSEEERGELTRLSRSRLASVRLVQRAQILLLVADGMRNAEMADLLGIGRVQVSRWRGVMRNCACRDWSATCRAAHRRRK